jgi:hypothetical protein
MDPDIYLVETVACSGIHIGNYEDDRSAIVAIDHFPCLRYYVSCAYFGIIEWGGENH